MNKNLGTLEIINPNSHIFWMIFALYIFDNKDVCIYSHQWTRTERARTPENVKEEQKLMIGLLKAINSFVAKTAPSEYVKSIFC